MNSSTLIRGFQKIPDTVRCVFRILFNSFMAWMDHRAASKGAALAFYTLFSLTPIMVLAIAIAGYFFGAEFTRQYALYFGSLRSKSTRLDNQQAGKDIPMRHPA